MKKIVCLLTAALLLAACGPSREERVAQIEHFQDSLYELSVAADPNTADEITDLYVAFVDKYPADTLSPQYLLRAAEVQSNVLHTDRAIALFDRLIDNYPDYEEEVAISHYLKGVAYDLNGQYDEARAAYEEFVELYPDHYMAEQTRLMLPHVGSSPEEILDRILANVDDNYIEH